MCVLAFVLIWYNLIGFAYFMMAQSTERNQGCQGASGLYENAVRWNPQIVEARQRAIACNMKLGKREASIALLEPLSAMLLSSSDYWLEMTFLYYMIADDKKTLDGAKHLGTEIPEVSWIEDLGEQLYDLGMHPTSEQVFRFITVYGGYGQHATYFLAWSIFKQERFEAALGHFNECIERYAKGSKYWIYRCHAGKGFVLNALGKTQEAREEFLQSLVIESSQTDVKEALQKLPK